MNLKIYFKNFFYLFLGASNSKYLEFVKIEGLDY